MPEPPGPSGETGAQRPGQPASGAGDLLDALRQRITAAADGDLAAVLSDQALAAADELLRRSVTADGAWPAEVLHGIALLWVMRYLCAGADEDRMTALGLLTELRLAAPVLAPDELFTSLDATATDGIAVLGASLLRQAQEQAGRQLLDRATELLQAAVAATPEEDPNRSARLSNLCVGRRLRAEHHGGRADLAFAITAGEEAVSACRDGDDRPGCLANLADALHTRFEYDGGAENLDQALTAYRAAADAAPPGHPLHGVLLSKLGAALASRYTLSGSVRDLAEGIRLCTQAVAATADSEFAAQAQASLARAVAMRGAATGSLADLEQAITAARDAVEASAPQGAAVPARWHNLAAALYDRYQVAGAAEDLDGAIAAARATLTTATAAEDSPVYLGMLLANVSILLRVRGERDRDPTDLEAALAAARQALALCPEDHPARTDRVNNLGTALLARYEHQQAGSTRPEDIGEGIAILSETAADPAASAGRPALLSTLGLLLLRRFQHDGATADLTAALEVAASAVAAHSAHHPGLAGAALNLGSACREAFTHRHHQADFDGAVASWRAGASAAGSPAALRLACARQWADLAAAGQAWTLAAEGYAQSVALLPYACWRGLNRTDQEQGLLRYATMAADAAASAVAAGEPAAAVSRLEQGRALLWTQQLEMRDSWASLQASQPALAASLDRIRRTLDGGGLPPLLARDG